jgi:hypothetical protein
VYRSGSVSFDIAGVVNFLPLFNAKSPLVLAAFAGAGIGIPFQNSAISYGKVGAWPKTYSGSGSPTPDRSYSPLSDEIGTMFLVKFGARFGYDFGPFAIFLTGQMRLAPLLMSGQAEALVTDGNEMRSLKATMPTGISPSITLGMRYAFAKKSKTPQVNITDEE